LYDGVCGLCNRLVQFILRRDRTEIFRFAALQSVLGAQILIRNGISATDLDTVYVVLNFDSPKEKLLPRSRAIVFIGQQLGGIWRILAACFDVLPEFLRDWLYNHIAHNRYRIFGRYETCAVPSPETRARFLDV